MKEHYGYRRRVDMSFEQASQRIRETLKEQGFGVLTEIDVAATLKEKLEVDFGRRYVILGACNPSLAHRALQREPELGLLLPCNVIVYEDGEGTVVSAIEPEAALGIVDNDALKKVAQEAGARLRRAVDAV